VSVRAIESRDVEAILAIQSVSPEIAKWTARDYGRVAEGEMAGWVIEEGNQVTGFLVARRIASDLEILNFAVRPETRKKGAGRTLVGEALAWAKTFGAQKAFLEVRSSNLAALRFYERQGFEVTGRRPRYYAAPIEDALVLAVALA
jgi:[ribosomal protein S18]-alanine N-acetyltransferase